MFRTAFLSIMNSLELYTQQQVYVITVMMNTCYWDQEGAQFLLDPASRQPA